MKVISIINTRRPTVLCIMNNFCVDYYFADHHFLMKQYWKPMVVEFNTSHKVCMIYIWYNIVLHFNNTGRQYFVGQQERIKYLNTPLSAIPDSRPNRVVQTMLMLMCAYATVRFRNFRLYLLLANVSTNATLMAAAAVTKLHVLV